jgi:hypothetical protein
MRLRPGGAMDRIAASSEKGGLPHSLSAETKAVNPCALERWEDEGGGIEAEAVPALRSCPDGMGGLAIASNPKRAAKADITSFKF